MISRFARVASVCAAAAAIAALPALPASAATPTALTPTHACPTGSVPEDWMVDVPASSTFESAVDCLVWWKIAAGFGSYTYQPATPITRGQMAKFLALAITSTGGTLPQPGKDYFTDDNASAFETYINQLAAAGIVNGVDATHYQPDGVVTRGAMAKFLVRAFEYRSGTTLPHDTDYFRDDSTSVFRQFIDAAAGAGFAGGYTDGTFRPDVSVTREQMAAFLSRELEKTTTDVSGATTPPPAAARPALAAYVADGTDIHLRDATNDTDTVLATVPSGTSITSIAVSPDGQQVAYTTEVDDTNGNPTTSVYVVPAAGGTPVSVDPQHALADSTVDHLSWGSALVVTAFMNDSSEGFYRLTPEGNGQPQASTGPLVDDCAAVDSLPTGQALWSGCSDGIVLGTLDGTPYAAVNAADADGVAVSPDGQQIAYLSYTFDSQDNPTGTDIVVAPSVNGTPKVAAHLDASGSQPWFAGDVQWQDASTLLYLAAQLNPTSDGFTTPPAVYTVPAAGGTPAAAAGFSGTEQDGLAVRSGI